MPMTNDDLTAAANKAELTIEEAIAGFKLIKKFYAAGINNDPSADAFVAQSTKTVIDGVAAARQQAVAIQGEIAQLQAKLDALLKVTGPIA